MRRRNYLVLQMAIAASLLWGHGAHADLAWVGPMDGRGRTGGESLQRLGGAVIVDASTGRREWTAVPTASVRSLAVGLDRSAVDGIAVSAARSAGVDPHLVKAVAWAESAFRADAVSPRGAMGVMQLMPATARQYGVADPFDAVQSLNGGASLLRDLLQRYEGDVPLTLAAYNAGPGAVERAGRSVPNYPETRAYIGRVMGVYERLRGATADNVEVVIAGAPRGLQVARPAPASMSPSRAVGNAWVVEVPASPRQAGISL